MTAVLLAVVMSFSPMTVDTAATSESIAVFVSHKKHGRTPAHIERMSLRTYTGRIMASGAWPADIPMESLKAGAAVIAQRGRWLVKHRDPRFHWRGQRFDVFSGSSPRWCPGCDAGMYYRPGVYVHSRIRHAIEVIWPTVLRRDGRQLKPQWSGEGRWCGDGRTGNRLPEGGATACARKGWGWRAILRLYLRRVEFA